jgi:hypothetical protein
LKQKKPLVFFKEQGWVSYNIKGKLLKKKTDHFGLFSVNDGTPKNSPPKRKKKDLAHGI